MENACLLIFWGQLAHNIPNYLETSKNQENSGYSASHHNDKDRQRLTAKLQCKCKCVNQTTCEMYR